MPAICLFSQSLIKSLFSEVPFAETMPELVLSQQGLISEKYMSLCGLAACAHLGKLFWVLLHEIKDFLCQFPRL